MAEKLDK